MKASEKAGFEITRTFVEEDRECIHLELKRELKELQQIPGVGKSIASDLWDLGLRSIEGLRGQDPEELYLELCAQKGILVDRCLLYVFRCAVYYASNKEHDPELLKWWNWKDK